MTDEQKTNRQHKDSVFTSLFSTKENMIELYNAIAGASYDANVPLEIKTLDGVLYNVRKNDVSFTIDNEHIILFEHQSTLNPNMPVRALFYLARNYEGIVDPDTIYSQMLYPLPTPHIYMLYNGTDYCPDNTELRLSDAFIAPSEQLVLELIVKVVNINYGHNMDVLNQSPNLYGYSFFIDRIRQNMSNGLDRDEAIKKAINYCIEHDILRKYLREKGSEVINMLLNQYNVDDAIRVARKETEKIVSERTWKEAEKVIGERTRKEAWEEAEKVIGERNKLQFARNLLASGMSIGQVALLAELSVEKVNALANNSGMVQEDAAIYDVKKR